MKHSPLIRRTRLKSVSEKNAAQPKKARKPLKKANPERQKKVKVQYAKKLAAYKRSETYRIVEARSQGQCERRYGHFREPFGEGRFLEGSLRCGFRATHHHHLTYARFGGQELPEDILHVCPECHDYLESLKPAGNRRSRSAHRSPDAP